MKNLRLYLLLFAVLFITQCCSSQTFDRRDYMEKDDFNRNVKFSKEFQTEKEIKCKNLSVNNEVWQYKDTLDFNLNRIAVWQGKNKRDSIKLDTVFTTADYLYIMSQFNYYSDKGMKWVTNDKWKLIKPDPKSRPVIPYWEFSQPLYSKDYTKCVVIMNHYESTFNLKLQTVLFYKTRKGDWVEKAVLRTVETMY